MADSGQEKTEQPTQKKLTEAREKGNVAKSMEINSFAIFTFGLLILFSFQGYMGDKIASNTTSMLGNLDQIELTKTIFLDMFIEEILLFFGILAPLLVGLVIIALVAGFGQIGIQISLKAIAPDFGKLDPIKGLKNKLFSSKNLMEMAKTMVKLTIIGFIIYTILSKVVVESTNLVSLTIIEIVEFMIVSSKSFLWKMAIAFAVLAIVDYAYQKYKFNKDMMMTKEEIKEESKQSDGSPEIKSRIKKEQFSAARKRMMKELPTADVVVTNPTHFAVALRYDMKKDHAPTVIAKGADLIAKKIREVAKDNNIPLYEEPPLARALFKACEVGDSIPEDLFQAVAQILAHIYRLKNEKSRKSIV